MSNQSPPPQFVGALGSLRKVALPKSLALKEVPAPVRLAPYAAALSIETVDAGHSTPLGASTLVILFDPSQAKLWGSPFRLVGQLRAQIDEDMSTDPLLGDVLWQSLESGLRQGTAGASLLMGTLTREISETFGGLELQGSTLNVELRCSWTPSQLPEGSVDLASHVEAWGHYLLEVAAVPHNSYFGLEVHDG